VWPPPTANTNCKGQSPDVTVQANYSHVNGINTATFYGSIPLPIFNRNQGEIARTRVAITQAQEQEKATNGQALTDVRDAYEGLRTSEKVVTLYRSGYLDVAQKDRDISEYAYKRGAASLLDFLDAERSYRATQLAYRQALASYLLALEQLREAVGVRNLPWLVNPNNDSLKERHLWTSKRYGAGSRKLESFRLFVCLRPKTLFSPLKPYPEAGFPSSRSR
jgi:Outer membrane efflux protein